MQLEAVRLARLTSTAVVCAIAALFPIRSAEAQVQVIANDVKIEDGLCVGTGCSTNPGSDYPDGQVLLSSDDAGLVLVDNADTNVWEVLIDTVAATDTFAIRDFNDNTLPLVIENGAPDNTFYIAAGGDIGLGTAIPQTNLHVVDPVASAVRLENNTNTRFDLMVEPVGFSLRDAVSGNRVFFAAENVPAGTLFLGEDALSINGSDSDYDVQIRGTTDPTLFFADASTDRIGLGTNVPAEPLHVFRTDGTASVLVENAFGSTATREMLKIANNGGSYATFENTNSGTTWYLVHENADPHNFIIADGVADGPEMTLTAGGDLTIPGQLFTAGSCAAGCDRVFDADYPLPTIAEQAALMKSLKHLPNVGPTPEDGPFNITAMTGGMLNELEKAHLYIAELEARDRATQDRIARLEALVADLAAR
ncbi:hypothetical protein ACOXXX_18330 [Thalassococcus sp. BH17M4-6]|uniref:hypothetical protein n=1 Tax=Thalassococcus sp. BH17M4-6 TaxID=3413148 RepID=UPI003BC5D608